ncbi:MAG: hypothetical protein JNL96_17230 [Planctomycetaceae bacterium]|nr:hypothetical protein [Planctomycetaceae bacterium]
MQKSLDQKLAAIHADPSGCREFIIADAKDADMAFGMASAGETLPDAHGRTRFKTLAEYREQIRQIVRQGKVDIMLMSASNNDILNNQERLFDNSHITPAARANDTTDVWVARGNGYIQQPSLPFRSASLDHIQGGRIDCTDAERRRGTNLGLYSITFNNRLDLDKLALERYAEFRAEAERKGFRHFLEVFDPNAPEGLTPEATPGFINDCIARTLAGVAYAGRPIFLKVVYHGPKAMEELVAYDPHLVVGILGGGSGTTYDAFKLIAEAQKYGARVALYGRKINHAENQLAFVEFLRLIADGVISPEEAVRAYHGVLAKMGIKPHRKLDDDLQLQTAVMSYGGGSTASVPAAIPAAEKKPITIGSAGPATAAAGSSANSCGCPTKKTADAPKAGGCGCGCSGKKDSAAKVKSVAEMTQAEKLAYNQAKRDKMFGKF